MSLLKKIQDFWCKKYYYVTNRDTLKKYTESEISFAIDYNLHFCFQCFILDNEKKYSLSALNLDADRSKKKPPLGVRYYCNNNEYHCFDEMFSDLFLHLDGQFKVMVEENEPEIFMLEATRIEL